MRNTIRRFSRHQNRSIILSRQLYGANLKYFVITSCRSLQERTWSKPLQIDKVSEKLANPKSSKMLACVCPTVDRNSARKPFQICWKKLVLRSPIYKASPVWDLPENLSRFAGKSWCSDLHTT